VALVGGKKKKRTEQEKGVPLVASVVSSGLWSSDRGGGTPAPTETKKKKGIQNNR
jgi:hypothetical protein